MELGSSSVIRGKNTQVIGYKESVRALGFNHGLMGIGI